MKQLAIIYDYCIRLRRFYNKTWKKHFSESVTHTKATGSHHRLHRQIQERCTAVAAYSQRCQKRRRAIGNNESQLLYAPVNIWLK
ncbi:hypothetical protein T10_309 [Trichinella papuae]|uniref:Uncharacterized protein n=1 Tax=Trichinella papuae TaxID=268474 RepID=A0A0V1N9S3_9BILA|nr:hypothetical protein T10_309 [Trichinella papuae]